MVHLEKLQWSVNDRAICITMSIFQASLQAGQGGSVFKRYQPSIQGWPGISKHPLSLGTARSWSPMGGSTSSYFMLAKQVGAFYKNHTPPEDIYKPKTENSPLMKEAKGNWHKLCQETDVSWPSSATLNSHEGICVSLFPDRNVVSSPGPWMNSLDSADHPRQRSNRTR